MNNLKCNGGTNKSLSLLLKEERYKHGIAVAEFSLDDTLELMNDRVLRKPHQHTKGI